MNLLPDEIKSKIINYTINDKLFNILLINKNFNNISISSFFYSTKYTFYRIHKNIISCYRFIISWYKKI